MPTTFFHTCTVHDPASDKPVTKVYDHISRLSSGSKFELQQGESGKFYGEDLEPAILSLTQYCKDNYDWDTFQYPVQVTIYPHQ